MTSNFARRTFLRNTILLAFVTAIGCTLNQNEEPSTEEKGPKVYLDYDQAELDAAYNQSPWAPNLEHVRARKNAQNTAATSRIGKPERIAYGPTESEQLDLYRTEIHNAPIHIYIHGGAWRMGGGTGTTAAIAEMFVKSGAHYLAPDYTLVQDAEGSLFPMVDQLRRAIVWAYQNASKFSGDRNQIYISGHSAGAHLAAVVLTTDWLTEFGVPMDIIKGGLCISGMFDLYPVSLSARGEYVAFTDNMVELLSPIRQLDKLTARIIVSYGTQESPEFQRQSRAFVNELSKAGKDVQLLVGVGYNHFEINETLTNPHGLLGFTVLKQMGLTNNTQE